MKPKYLTIRDVSKATSLASSTLYTYVRLKQVPYIKCFGRIIFEEEKIRRWLENKRIKEEKRK